MNPSPKTKKILFWLGLSLPMLALVAMTWLVHKTGGQFNTSFNYVMHTYKVLDRFEQTQAHIVDAEASQRGFLLTGRTEYVEPYQHAMRSIRDDLAELKQLTGDDLAQQANLDQLEKMVAANLVFDPATAFPPGQTPANAPVVTLSAQGKQKLEQMRRVLFQAHEEQEQALVKHQQHAEADVITGQIMSLTLIVAVAVEIGRAHV